MLSRAVIGLQAGKCQPLGCFDCLCKCYHRGPAVHATSLAPTIDFGETFHNHTPPDGGRRQSTDIAGIINADNNPYSSNQSRDAFNLARVGDLVGNQDVCNAFRDKCLCIRHLLAANPASSAMFQLISSYICGFVGFA
jgi:hypothetical protein